MNVYDFDKTVFYPDSSAKFIAHCAARYPVPVCAALLRALPRLVPYLLGGRRDATRLKERIFSFLPHVDDAEREVRSFWNANMDRVGEWYKKRRRDSDVIITGSPEFLLTPAAETMGFHLIGTRMDIKTGRIDGLNCGGREKLRRFREAYPDATPEEFYSDSGSDAPMAALSRRAYKVKKGIVSEW